MSPAEAITACWFVEAKRHRPQFTRSETGVVALTATDGRATLVGPVTQEHIDRPDESYADVALVAAILGASLERHGGSVSEEVDALIRRSPRPRAELIDQVSRRPLLVLIDGHPCFVEEWDLGSQRAFVGVHSRQRVGALYPATAQGPAKRRDAWTSRP